MDSYATLEYANEYHAKRMTATRWDLFTDDEKERRLVSASDFIDINFSFKDNLNIEARENGEAPKALMNATCEVAVLNELVSSRSREKESVKVDVIEVKYKDQDSGYSDALKRIALMLDSLLVKANSLFFKVYR